RKSPRKGRKRRRSRRRLLRRLSPRKHRQGTDDCRPLAGVGRAGVGRRGLRGRPELRAAAHRRARALARYDNLHPGLVLRQPGLVEGAGRLHHSAKASLLATEYARRGVIVTVVGDVARAYLELRDLDQQTVIAQSTVETRRQSLDLARARFQGGLTSELDVRQGESELARSEGRVADIRLQAGQKEHELNVLLARMPGTVPRGAALINQTFRTQVPPGLPSTLLQRRPD